MKVTNNTNQFEAWQHTLTESDETGAFPRFIVDLAAKGAVRTMPDGSIHITTEPDGRLIPVPLNYWVIYDETNNYLDAIAPDRFEIEFSAV